MTSAGDYTAVMIRPCEPAELDEIGAIINDAAVAYRGVIPADCWHEPYMPEEDLQSEVAKGVVFSGCYEGDRLVAVMGIQHVADVSLIRHAYTRTGSQGRGLGTRLLSHLRAQTARPLLIGTWKAATWAIRFYEGQGFQVVSEEQKSLLLARYWTVSPRQSEVSVVLTERQRT